MQLFFKFSNSNIHGLISFGDGGLLVGDSYLVSSATSTSAGAVMGALECPAVGSSVFSSPFVELITCGKERQSRTTQTHASGQWLKVEISLNLI